jgi:hypothetical protein
MLFDLARRHLAAVGQKGFLAFSLNGFLGPEFRSEVFGQVVVGIGTDRAG